MNLSVHVSGVRQDTAVVAVDGELDVSTAALLEAVLLPLPGQGVRHLIVAADRLRFCDVCGFRVLAGMHTILVAIGGALVLAEPTPVLRRLTDLMQRPPTSLSDSPIRVYATVVQALREEAGRPLSSVAALGPP
ncbi:STAS domain-containing protein [Streptosporangium sp. CA-135522]|uniref:STAS domain-containing protein n=1 Tax=Streptosporangium sp. CA-135522 TaxID=3240072 RepID=UPI003D8E642D